MKKLTLEHLAGYLPYGLKCEILNYKRDYVGEKYGVITGYYFYAGEPHYMFKSKDYAGKDASIIKPILRPLSDLTKEIEVGGEKFVPVDYLDSIECPTNYFEDTDFYDYMIDWINSEHKDHHLRFFPYGLVTLLHEWHFDIHNLISEGLSIDINTL